MNYIKKLTAILFILTLAAPSLVIAQEADQQSSLKPGARALQFQITDDGILDSFSGSVLSYKWHQTSSQANRLGVSFNGRYSERNTDFDDRSNKDSISNLSLAVQFSWMRYLNPDADVKFYFGYGPEIVAQYRKGKSEQNGADDTVVKETDLGAGVLGYAGVEWFFQESMSVHAEYQASADYLHGKQQTDNVNVEGTSNSISIGGDGVLFGLSVYF